MKKEGNKSENDCIKLREITAAMRLEIFLHSKQVVSRIYKFCQLIPKSGDMNYQVGMLFLKQILRDIKIRLPQKQTISLANYAL